MTLRQPEIDQATDEQPVAQKAARDERSKAAFFLRFMREEKSRCPNIGVSGIFIEVWSSG